MRPMKRANGQGSLAYIGSEKAIADLPLFNGNVASGGGAAMLFWRSAYLVSEGVERCGEHAIKAVSCDGRQEGAEKIEIDALALWESKVYRHEGHVGQGGRMAVRHIRLQPLVYPLLGPQPYSRPRRLGQGQDLWTVSAVMCSKDPTGHQI